MKNKESFKEIIRYLIFGVLTTIINLVVYYGLVFTVLNPEHPIELQIANMISWFCAVLFAYITNRIFVFKSKNEKKLVEGVKFFASRILTLFLDMAVMFLGVSILHFSDKIIKILNQGIVIVCNYILSKVFVFKNKKEKRKKHFPFRVIFDSILYYSLFGMPVFITICQIFSNTFINYLSLIISIIYLLWFLIGLIWNKKNRSLIFIFVIYFMIQECYLISKNVDIFENSLFFIQIFLLPFAGLYFYQIGNQKMNQSFLPKLFFETLFCSLFFYQTGVPHSLIAILVMSFPCTLYSLSKHKNFLLQVVGFGIIFSFLVIFKSIFLSLEMVLFLTFLIIKDWKKKKEKKYLYLILSILSLGVFFYTWIPEISTLKTFETFNARLELVNHQNNLFQNGNIEEKIFGISMIKDAGFVVTGMDFIDIFYFLGYAGFLFYMFFLLSFAYFVYIDIHKRFGIFASLLYSALEGFVLTNGFSNVLMGTNAYLMPKEKKSVLVVSNMYPSKKFKHYGSFVQNCEEILKSLGFHVNHVVLRKHPNKMIRLFSYFLFYIKSFMASFFLSYDYVYVHFVSHSAFGIFLSRLVCFKTEYIFNTHGNDIVKDYSWEEKNIKRSQFILPYADKVIAPSSYFKEVLVNDYHISQDKIFVTPSGGVNKNVFHSISKEDARKKLGLEENKFYVGFVGRIEKNKGWDTFLKTIKELKKTLPDVRGLVVGSGLEEKDFLKMVQHLGLETIVKQVPFVSQKDLVLYYNAFDILLYPTRRKSESLGLIGLEAMACETLVVGCDLYGPKEYLKDGVNSFTFHEDKDGSYLAKKIQKIRKMDENVKKEILKNALETVRSYDEERVQKDLEQIFK